MKITCWIEIRYNVWRKSCRLPAPACALGGNLIIYQHTVRATDCPCSCIPFISRVQCLPQRSPDLATDARCRNAMKTSTLLKIQDSLAMMDGRRLLICPRSISLKMELSCKEFSPLSLLSSNLSYRAFSSRNGYSLFRPMNCHSLLERAKCHAFCGGKQLS